MLNQTLFLSIVISFFVYESDLAVNVIPPRLLVYCKPILLGSLILFTDINNKKERRKHMNQWIETETIATEVNLNKDFAWVDLR